MTPETTAPTKATCWCCGEPRADDELARLQCHDEVALCAVCVDWLSDRLAESRSSPSRPRLRRAIPIFVSADLGAALDHYRALGFEAEAYEGGGYAFVFRDGLELHLGEVERLDPDTNTSACYLHVSDADALHAEWAAAGVGGRLVAPTDTDYGLHEGAHVDPDGNLLRFGSPVAGPSDAAVIEADDPVAVAAGEAIRAGDVLALERLLAENPELATAWIGDDTMARTLLHAATDWPGHFPNGPAAVAALVRAGADVDARFRGPHNETPLHWAASSDDVEVLDALLDAGADIEASGAVLGGGAPLADAIGFGQWNAARRLVARGARTRLKDAAALGMLDRLEAAFAGDEAPEAAEVTGAFWSACHGGQLEAAEYLLQRGADINWLGWDDMTPLDVARGSAAETLVDWLRRRGAKSAADLPEERAE